MLFRSAHLPLVLLVFAVSRLGRVLLVPLVSAVSRLGRVLKAWELPASPLLRLSLPPLQSAPVWLPPFVTLPWGSW